jgi:hypothetical protein
MQMEQKAAENQTAFIKKFKESEFMTEKDKEDLIVEKMKKEERSKYLKQYSVSNKKVINIKLKINSTKVHQLLNYGLF